MRGDVPLPFSQCRLAARSVVSADGYRECRDVIRPRGPTKVLRQRAPLALQILLADREGRLAWKAAHDFTILQPPAGHRRLHGRGVSALRVLDAHWDVLAFAAIMLALLGVASVLSIAAPATRHVGLWFVVAVVAVIAVVLMVVAVTQFRALVMGHRRRTVTALGAIESALWSLALCHVTDPARVQSALVTARALVTSEDQHLFCAEAAVTTIAARRSLAQATEPLAALPPVRILLGSADTQLEMPSTQRPLLGRELGFLLGASAIVVAVVAQQVGLEEQRLCPENQSCESAPTSYGDALYWSISRVLGGDPEGLGVAALGSRVVGLLLTFYGLFVLAFILNKVLERRIADDAQSVVELVEEFNDRRRSVVEPTAPAPPSCTPESAALPPGVAYFLIGVLAGLSTKTFHARLVKPRRPGA